MECRRHGKQRPTFICQHLQHGHALGFFVPDAPPSEEEPWKAAWCSACEEVRQKEGGWNERSEPFSGVLAICEGCYEEIRRRNEIRRRWWEIWK
jgi:hypothetical protein